MPVARWKQALRLAALLTGCVISATPCNWTAPG